MAGVNESSNDWLPPIPAAERMRGLEPEEVWNAEQLNRMRCIKFGPIPLPSQAHNQEHAMTHHADQNHRTPTFGESEGESEYEFNQSKNLASRNENSLPFQSIMKEKSGNPHFIEWVSITEHLDETDMQLLLQEARSRARVSLFLNRISESRCPPIRYIESPRGLGLKEFIEREWISKGFLPHEIDRRMLAAYDKKLVRAIENFEYANGILPDALRFPKVGNRRSKKERGLTP